MTYFYGPVPSRRLGFSLGVDLLPITEGKICSFDCVYCQLFKTHKKTIRRSSYVNLAKLKEQLQVILQKHPKIDYLTISGSGEPTLHKDLDKIIWVLKDITKNKVPVCVITNSSLLYRKKIRDELKGANLIVPSLDAATRSSFEKINKPYRDIYFKKVIKGLVALRKEFKGKIWLEVMLVKGINDTIAEAKKFKQIIDKINPDRVQINLAVRPSGLKQGIPSVSRVNQIKKIIGGNVEVIAKFSKSKQKKISTNSEMEVLTFLSRRPANFDDLANSIGVDVCHLKESLTKLLANKKIKEYTLRGEKYFIRK